MERKYGFGRLKEAANFKYKGIGNVPLVRTHYFIGDAGKVLSLEECRQIHTVLQGKVDLPVIQNSAEKND